LSKSSSGWKSSIDPISTSTVCSESPTPGTVNPLSGKATEIPIRSITSSRLSTSTLIGFALANEAPASDLPAIARPEKSPNNAIRNGTLSAPFLGAEPCRNVPKLKSNRIAEATKWRNWGEPA
jgi:hypothetical protein